MPLAATQTLMAAHRTAIDLERDRLEEEAAENGVELPDELELSPETKRSMDVAFRNWHTANKDNLTDLTPQELEPHNLGAEFAFAYMGRPAFERPDTATTNPKRDALMDSAAKYERNAFINDQGQVDIE